MPGVAPDQTVAGTKCGRRFRVLATDEWVFVEAKAFGPYCRLQALDDPACTVIWRRAWYVVPGEQIQLFAEAA